MNFEFSFISMVINMTDSTDLYSTKKPQLIIKIKEED
jgi:hypothetical protein